MTIEEKERQVAMPDIRKQVMAMRRDILADPGLSHIFHAKKREFEILVSEEEQVMRETAEVYAKTFELWLNYKLQATKMRIEMFQKEANRFAVLAAYARRKGIRDSNERKEKAKEVLCQDIMPTESKSRYGERMVFLCPLHGEKTPSFYIYTKDNRYHCYGCGKHGDVISLYQELHSCDFKTAVLELTRLI